MEKEFDRSVYQDKEKLSALLSTKTIKQIANELHVSVKLINLWAITHGLIVRTPEMKLP